MMWFLASLFIVIVIAVWVTITGRCILRFTGILYLLGRTPENFAAAAIIGTGAWLLFFGYLSYLGLSAKWIAAIVGCLSIILIFIVLRRERPDFFIPACKARTSIILGGLLLVAAIVNLLPIGIGNTFDVANDAFVYVAIGDYLKEHGFGSPVVVDLYQPALGQVIGFQRGGNPIGAGFFLALVNGFFPTVRAIYVYPSVMAWGTALNLLAFFLLSRWTLRIPRNYSLLGAWLLAITPNPMHTAAATGFLLQTYGTAAFAFALAWQTRLLGCRRFDKRTASLLGFAWAFLLSVYSVLFPILLLASGVAFAFLMVSRRAYCPGMATRLLGVLVTVVLAWSVFSNVEIARAMRAILVLKGVVVGCVVPWDPLEFWAFAMGVRPGGVHDSSTMLPLWAIAGIGLCAGLFFLAGLWKLLRNLRACAIINSLAIFALMIGYFLFVAPEAHGSQTHRWMTWSIYKIAQWSFLLVLGLQIAGLELWAKRWKFSVTLGVFALVALLALPVQFVLAGERAQKMQDYAQSEWPIEAYYQLSEIVDRYEADVIYLVSPHGQNWPRILLTYFLYPRPVASDWSDTAYMDIVRDLFAKDLNPIQGNVLYLVVGVPLFGQNADKILPSGVAVVRDDPVIFEIKNPNGVERRNSRTFFWMGGGDTCLGITSPKTGYARLTIEMTPGPSLPETSQRRLIVHALGSWRREIVINEYPTTIITVPLQVGANQVCFSPLDKPTVLVQPNEDRRPLLLGVSDVQIKLLPEAASVDHAAMCSFALSSGWHSMEQNGQGWWRWTDGRGRISVTVRQDTSVILSGDINSIQRPNRVDILLNGEKVRTLDVDWSEWAFYPFEPISFPLKAGENVIEFVSQNPAITIPTDSRPLAIAVRNLRLQTESGQVCELQP